MKKTIEELERVKKELVELFDKSDFEHKQFLLGDIILVIEDRLFELKAILKHGVIWRDNFGAPRKEKSYPKDIAPADYFYRDEKKELKL